MQMLHEQPTFCRTDLFCRPRLFFQHSYGFYEGNKRGVLAASWLDFDNFTLVGTVFGSVSLKLTRACNLSKGIKPDLHFGKTCQVQRDRILTRLKVRKSAQEF